MAQSPAKKTPSKKTARKAPPKKTAKTASSKAVAKKTAAKKAAAKKAVSKPTTGKKPASASSVPESIAATATTASMKAMETGSTNNESTATGNAATMAPPRAAPAAASQKPSSAAKPSPSIADRPSTRHFPVSIFGATLGLAGFAMLWREAGGTLGFGIGFSELLFAIAAGFYISVLGLYILKVVRHPDALGEDFTNPVTANFFAAASMTMIVLAAGMRPYSPDFAEIMWAIGTTAQVTVSVLIVSQWVTRDCHVTAATPTWFLPIAGNLLISIVGTPMGYEQIGWMIFGVGILFWMVVQTVVFYRLLFTPQMEHPQRPTIVIIIAPPSLAFTAYLVLNDGVLGGPSYMFFGLAVFMALITLAHVPTLIRLPFGLSCWAYTFPLSAFGVAAFLLSDASGNDVYQAIAILVLAVLTIIVAIVSSFTVRALIRGDLFRLPPLSRVRVLNLQPDENL